MKSTIMKQVIWGILLIAIGIGYLGQVMGYWYFTLFFPGWWTLLLILPALYSMIDHGISFWALVVLLLGSYYLAEANSWIDFKLTIPVIASVGCICLGVKILFARRVKWYDYGRKD